MPAPSSGKTLIPPPQANPFFTSFEKLYDSVKYRLVHGAEMSFPFPHNPFRIPPELRPIQPPERAAVFSMMPICKHILPMRNSIPLVHDYFGLSIHPFLKGLAAHPRKKFRAPHSFLSSHFAPDNVSRPPTCPEVFFDYPYFSLQKPWTVPHLTGGPRQVPPCMIPSGASWMVNPPFFRVTVFPPQYQSTVYNCLRL